MRCVAGAGLLALVGCNQVFGLDQTREIDAAIDQPTVQLTWQVARLTPSGDPDPAIADLPIVPPPRVRHAALADAALRDAVYAPDGTIAIPRDYLVPGTTWRLEYTLADGLAHEVQWSPEANHGQIAVPVFGRPERTDPPAGGYLVSPSGAPAAGFTAPRVFTTGLWTEGRVSYAPPSTTIDYDFAAAASLSGKKGTPDPGQGDHALIVDYATDSNGCRTAVGAATLASAALTGARATPAAAWDVSTKPVTGTLLDFDLLARFTTALQWLDTPVTGTLSFGIAASAGMPGAPGLAPAALSTALLRVPVMLTLAQCDYRVAALPRTAQPASLDAFPRVLYAELIETRSVLGAVLRSGLTTAILAQTSQNLALTFPVAIPTRLVLTTPNGAAIDLTGATEPVDVGPTAGRFTLDITQETTPGTSVDAYEVTLHGLGGGAPTPLRVFTVTAPRVQIDGALLAPASAYTLEVRALKGHPAARQGDFRPVAYPYSTATVFSRAFRTP